MPEVALSEVAQIIRSKNAGPFIFTLDILFPDEESYQAVKHSGVINRETVASIYNTSVEAVLAVIDFPPARAIKVNLRRTIPSGSPGDSDVYGAQQHAPLLHLMVPLSDAATGSIRRTPV